MSSATGCASPLTSLLPATPTCTTRASSLLLPPPGDAREFQTHLEKYVAELPVPVSEFIARARAARGTDELRRDLGIGFAD